LAPSNEATQGLRERKKAKTRSAIQTLALRLFREQGYDATTVQQIIEEADVSESTFFRYFPTKADVVLFDDFDPVIVEAFRRQPKELSAISAFRRAFSDSFRQLSTQDADDQMDRMRLCLSVPELRSAILDQLAGTMDLLVGELVERSGRSPQDVEVRTLAGAVVGIAISGMFALAEDPSRDLLSLLDESLAALDQGFDL
jgi:AcrR family transcriptional regulator